MAYLLTVHVRRLRLLTDQFHYCWLINLHSVREGITAAFVVITTSKTLHISHLSIVMKKPVKYWT